MFTGFVKSIPLEIEEAAMIDGCSPIPVSYTHLDVYKRQAMESVSEDLLLLYVKPIMMSMVQSGQKKLLHGRSTFAQ